MFAALEYVNSTPFPEAGTLAMTMVALLLPLSSLWAGMAIDDETSTLNLSNLSGPDSTRRGSKPFHSCHGPRFNQFGPLSSNSSAPESSTALEGSIAPLSPTSMDSRIGYIHSIGRDSTELDLEAMGVRIDISYEVRNES
jgi:pheromone alpha factor receptor